MTYRILTAAAVLVALAAPALADEIRPSGPPIVLQPSAGTLMQTTAPISNVFIANPDVASVQTPMEAGRDLVYIFAKKPGRTTVYALGEDGKVMLSRVVEVPGPRTVRVLRGQKQEFWSEAHGEPTSRPADESPTLADLPPGSAVTIPVGGKR